MNIKSVCVLVLSLLTALPYSAFAQPQSFLVFFEYGDSDIPHTGARIIKDAVDFIKSQPATRVEIIGHSDTAENADISVERARNVAAELITQGVPSDRIIYVAGVGDSKPLVPTPKGVEEAQNRNVFIRIYISQK